jgi:hypothetical protein
MRHGTRFDIQLPAENRRALDEPAVAAGLTAANMARIATKRLISRRDDVLHGLTGEPQIAGYESRHGANW